MARLMYLQFFAGLVVAATLFGACGGDEPVAFTVQDSGKAVTVERGELVTLRLDSNQTTGFRWNLVTEPDPSVLTLVSSGYEEPEDGLVGQGGTEVWRFEAEASGSTSFELAYFRPFDPAVVEGTFALTVTVE
jgi:inhibitor of cysteine peptidase